MTFAKLQATGNDFVVIDARHLKKQWASLARQICHRHFGVGADGLILVMPSKTAEVKMRMFNPDGSEAEVCGNGLRCLAKYVFEKGLVRGREFRVETQAGIKTVRVAVYRKKVKRVKVNMGTPAFAPEDIPVSRDSKNFGNSRLDITPIIDYPLKVDDVELSVSLVSLGNPHAVMFTTEPVSRFPLALIGPKVESHPLFPERINFEIARVLDERTIEVRVWERGAGETLSCGSGACAVATIARHKRLVDKPVDIILPGGKLSVTWAESGEVLINGPVEEIFIGQWLK